MRDQYFVTRPRMRLLEKFTNGGVRDFMKVKIGARPGQDRESHAFSLETETRTGGRQNCRAQILANKMWLIAS